MSNCSTLAAVEERAGYGQGSRVKYLWPMRISLSSGALLGCVLSISSFSEDALAARRCGSDTECEHGFICKGASSESDAAPTIGECVPDADPCKTDADCALDYECKYIGVASVSRVCDSEGNCTTGKEQLEDDSNYCVPRKLTCATDAECPEPATCSDGACVLGVTRCSADAECDARYECLARDREDESVRYCFPPPKACSSDADCDGWVCFQPPSDIPFGWQDISKGCMSPGFVALIEGRIDAPDENSESDSASASAPPQADDAGVAGAITAFPDASVAPKGERGSADSGQPTKAGSVKPVAQRASEGSTDGGCEVRGTGVRFGGWPWLVALALGFGLCRRRSRP